MISDVAVLPIRQIAVLPIRQSWHTYRVVLPSSECFFCTREFHKTTGEYTYDIPVGWCKKWPNKPFIKENNVESCLTVSVLSAESEDKRSKIKYDWKEYIADHDNDVKKEENPNLYNHQSIKPWYKDWPRKKY